jgi:hypothetical protein
MGAHIAKTIEAKPELVQISTTYGVQKEGSVVLPRNKYTVIRDDRPQSKDEAKQWLEFTRLRSLRNVFVWHQEPYLTSK